MSRYLGKFLGTAIFAPSIITIRSSSALPSMVTAWSRSLIGVRGA